MTGEKQSSIFKHCIQMLDDDNIRNALKKTVSPFIDMLIDAMWPYIYLSLFILLFLFLCTFVILGLLVQILRRNIIHI